MGHNQFSLLVWWSTWRLQHNMSLFYVLYGRKRRRKRRPSKWKRIRRLQKVASPTTLGGCIFRVVRPKERISEKRISIPECVDPRIFISSWMECYSVSLPRAYILWSTRTRARKCWSTGGGVRRVNINTGGGAGSFSILILYIQRCTAPASSPRSNLNISNLRAAEKRQDSGGGIAIIVSCLAWIENGGDASRNPVATTWRRSESARPKLIFSLYIHVRSFDDPQSGRRWLEAAATFW